jgi:ABC-type branched-subunit amino acid transport system substrate-binding protein
MKKGLFLILALLFFVSFSTEGICAGKDIKVAFLVPLTGGGAFYGTLMRDVGKAIVDEINKQGIKGFGKFEVIVYDEASDPTVAVGKMERAKMQGANFVWGGFSSAVEKAMVAKGEELKLPVIITNATSYEAFPNNTKYSVNPTMGSYEWGEMTAEYFKKEKVKTYAIIGADYLWGRTWDKTLTLDIKGAGIKKVYENWHDFSKVDFSSDIAKLKELKPDAVLRPFGGAGEYVIIKQMKEAGYWPRIYIGDTVDGGYQVLLDSVGEDYAVGVTAPSTQNPEKAAWINFAKTHQQKYGYRPTWLSDGMNDTLWFMKMVIEKAGSLDPDVLAKVMHESSYDGVSGSPCGPFQPCGQLRKGTAYLLKFAKGSPTWSDKIGVHREVVFKKDVVPLCKEGVEERLKEVK